ncbi:MAG: hypothetical protein CO182_11695 [Lysobacterales bacterium CG_4_9_14_3_um_filter_62_6]|nr:MAG: hypothetical protein CO182_11695 [Xanthomonadales bacterium CG_4_9_14_3_um_filter_62_6]
MAGWGFCCRCPATGAFPVRRQPPPPAVAVVAPVTPAAPVLEGQLDIIAWPGYIERGESDKAYDWVTEFEQASACKVNVKTADYIAIMGG